VGDVADIVGGKRGGKNELGEIAITQVPFTFGRGVHKKATERGGKETGLAEKRKRKG